MTDDSAERVSELVALGLDRREARWLAEEFIDERARHDAAKRRVAGEPLQYVIGHWPFRGLDLLVDERALIPRPESEELVEVALRELAGSNAPTPLIVDLGCGTGAIGLAVLDELRTRGIDATLVAIDESLEALALAEENARRHDLRTVTFVQSAWFDELDVALRSRVDLIVANPPYVGATEFAELDPVLRYEPRSAIVAPDARGVQGFADLEIIVTEAHDWLRPGGLLICEHANTHREAATALAQRVGYRGVKDLDDLAGLPRLLVARR